ncbi:MAG: hypothetical protein LUD17_06255 [Bacteroidales bacterium]|nr:hypothetical protein [Bacteroidales bacterium]
MSTATVTCSVKFVQGVGSYTAAITCSKGSLWQIYDQDTGALTPSFATLKPVLELVVYGSKLNSSGSSTVTPAAFRAWINGEELFFSDTTNLCTNSSFLGVFKRILPTDSEGNGHYGLQIVKDFVGDLAFISPTIELAGQLPASLGVTDTWVKATTTISVKPGQSDVAQMSIYAASGDFTLEEEGETVVLAPTVYKGFTDVTSSCYYKWYKMGSTGEWSEITGSALQSIVATGATGLLVTRDDVDGMQAFLCRAFTDTTYANILCSAVQTVQDTKDEYYIDPNPTPADMIITNDDADRSQVVFAPKLMRYVSGVATAVSPQPQFLFYIHDALGNPLNEWQDGVEGDQGSDLEKYTAPLSSYTVTLAQCQQADGDVGVIIQTADS